MKILKGRNLPTSLSSGVSSTYLARHLPSSTQRRSDFNRRGSTPPSNLSSTNSGSGSRMTKSPSSADNCMNGSRHGAKSSPTSMSKRSRSPSSAGSSWSSSSCRGRSPSARRRRTRSPSIADGYKRDIRIKRERSVAESKMPLVNDIDKIVETTKESFKKIITSTPMSLDKSMSIFVRCCENI